MSPRFDVIVCDQVRREDNGKFLLIGVYDQSIVLLKPTDIFVSFYLRFFGLSDGKHSLEFTVEGPLSNKVGGSGNLEVKGDDQAGSIVLPQLPLNVTGPGELTINITFDDEEPVQVLKLEIQMNPDALQSQ